MQVVSGPIDLATVPSSLSLESPQPSGIFVPQDNNSLSVVPSFLQTFHTTVVICSNRNKVLYLSMQIWVLFVQRTQKMNKFLLKQQITLLINWLVAGFNFHSQFSLMILVFLPSRIVLIILLFILGRTVKISVL